MHSLIRVIESQLAVPYVKSEPVEYDIGYSLTRYGIVLVARVSGLGEEIFASLCSIFPKLLREPGSYLRAFHNNKLSYQFLPTQGRI